MRPAIERWDAHELRFIGLDLNDLYLAVERILDLQTDDGRSGWRLDRVVASRLWEVACQPGVLPIANYDIQLAKRREAER
jgi:hypothetical protein